MKLRQRYDSEKAHLYLHDIHLVSHSSIFSNDDDLTSIL